MLKRIFELFDWMPVQGTSWAADVDWINNLISIISAVSTLLITGVMIYFAIKYRRKSEKQETAYITHDVVLETVWTVVPTIIVVFVFAYGFFTYREMRTVPANAIEVNVDAYKWRWEFTYSNGRKSTRNLVVPIGKPIRLVMTSHDVIHSFFLPSMRVKEDVYADNYSYLWFTPEKLGEFHIFCAEYCGLQHSGMTGKLKVVTPEEYQDFLLERKDGETPTLPPAESGKLIFAEKACNTCHSIDGSTIVGPTLKGLFSGPDRKFTDGTSAAVDENYVSESILNPAAKIVNGFPPAMTPYAGQLDDKQLSDLIAYLKTL